MELESRCDINPGREFDGLNRAFEDFQDSLRLR
jgi:hypothetical protein